MGDQILFGRIQTAEQTPFDGTETSGGTPVVPPFVSTNVRDGIIEAVKLAIENAVDRYLLLAQYNGNANTGRLLEFYSGIDSGDAPFHVNVETKVVDIISSTTGTSSNATIGFYDKVADPTFLTPLYVLDMDGLKTQEISGTTAIPVFTISAMSEIVIKVNTASIQKPHIQLTFSSGGL